ncbi:MAG: P-II family nitrogen regulator [Paludibacteraceae bacterium]|nr:P-II family nitrogen regulator [Paludibacteraceae bacterium]
MKKIEAIIRASKFDEVKEALDVAGIQFFSYWDVTGVGNDATKVVNTGRGKVSTSLIPRMLLTIVVRDKNLQLTIDAILSSAKTGTTGDGKIFVSDLMESYRIRTAESGNESLYDKELED